jgi:hypothetical protein
MLTSGFDGFIRYSRIESILLWLLHRREMSPFYLTTTRVVGVSFNLPTPAVGVNYQATTK